MDNQYALSDYDYDLPESLIAQQPLENRTDSRLLIVDTNGYQYRDSAFSEIASLITADDLLVFNNTQVIAARLLGNKETGGKIECLIERIQSSVVALAHIRASKAPRIGTRCTFSQGALSAIVTARVGALFELTFDVDDLMSTLKTYGEIPLPPYITRCPQKEDGIRYQTVYAKVPGAVAAPTAGLHFDDVILDTLAAKGVAMTEVTLHVGAGTFQPVRANDIREHAIHEEYLEVSESTCEAVNACRRRGGRVIAVGTTSVRALESAFKEGRLCPFHGDTRLFIYPGYQYRVVDVLITNFHLPKSSLLMLVCALAGHRLIFDVYRHAVAEGYRFFSYGDAMWLPAFRDQ